MTEEFEKWFYEHKPRPEFIEEMTKEEGHDLLTAFVREVERRAEQNYGGPAYGDKEVGQAFARTAHDFDLFRDFGLKRISELERENIKLQKLVEYWKEEEAKRRKFIQENIPVIG